MPRKSMEVLTESMLYVLLALRLRPMCVPAAVQRWGPTNRKQTSVLRGHGRAWRETAYDRTEKRHKNL